MRAGTVKQCLFGAALVNIRESLQISQYQLAKRTGIAEEYLNKLETPSEAAQSPDDHSSWTGAWRFSR